MSGIVRYGSAAIAAAVSLLGGSLGAVEPQLQIDDSAAEHLPRAARPRRRARRGVFTAEDFRQRVDATHSRHVDPRADKYLHAHARLARVIKRSGAERLPPAHGEGTR